MKYNPLMWHVMISRLKPGVRQVWSAGDVNRLIKAAKPVYKNLLGPCPDNRP